MALIKGTNAFADVADFDAYFTARLDVAAAINATLEEKEAALISATDVLNEVHWTGTIVSLSQPLAFPRVGTYFDPRAGGRICMDSTSIPERITKATLELAYHFLLNSGIRDSAGSVENLSVGTINLTNITTAPLIPSIVNTIIKPLKVNQGSSAWWRAN